MEERPVPKPKRDEALVEVKAAGINLMDSYVRRGGPASGFPLMLGVDGAGVVVAVGDQSTAKIGGRVAAVGRRAGDLRRLIQHLLGVLKVRDAAVERVLRDLERVFDGVAQYCGTSRASPAVERIGARSSFRCLGVSPSRIRRNSVWPMMSWMLRTPRLARISRTSCATNWK